MSTDQESMVADVLIVTAIGLEFDAVLTVDEGGAQESRWEDLPDRQGLRLASRMFVTANGQPLRIAVAQAATMRTEATADRAVSLLSALHPRCLAMCGVCAGRPNRVNLGDVIAATAVWSFDHTAVVVGRDSMGGETRESLPETRTYNLPSRWAQHLERYSLSKEVVQRLQKKRPRPLLPQIDWLLLQVASGNHEPWNHPEIQKYCPDYRIAVEQTWRKGSDEWLMDGKLQLTDAGRARALRLRILYPQGLPKLAKGVFRIRAAPIGTSNQLVRDETVWDNLMRIHRDVVGLEMEAAAIGAVAERNDIEHWLVMKGVMDFAHRDKDDRFKSFAARASAESLIGFLRQHLDVRRTWPLDVYPRSAAMISEYGWIAERNVPRVRASEASCAELVSVLKDRAKKILALLAKAEAAGRRSGSGRNINFGEIMISRGASKTPLIPEIKGEQNSTEEYAAEFKRLHELHIESLEGGQFVRAHETLSVIHVMLERIKEERIIAPEEHVVYYARPNEISLRAEKSHGNEGSVDAFRDKIDREE